ncbi:MAG TPA: hypothetical protein DC009_00460 [Porphyromonadaceae bacterium]|nr:hypothetical protein [Porphyromonadaceae bacterium]
MNRLGTTMSEFDSTQGIVENLANLQGPQFVDNIIRGLSSDDKRKAIEIIQYAYNNGGNGSFEETMVYNELMTKFNVRGEGYRNLNIRLDDSVRSISLSAACHLSSIISMGVAMSHGNSVVIYKDRIVFKGNNANLVGQAGNVGPNFFIEYGDIVYRFGSNLKRGFFDKQIDYVGAFPPTTPDNPGIFNMIYPRFA